MTTPTEFPHTSIAWLRILADHHAGNRKLLDGPDTYLSPAELILQHGQKFEARFQRARRGPRGFCYANAFQYAERTKGAIYVEGFACNAIPTEHAWCIRDGKIVDPTWGSEGRDYFGVALSLDTVRKVQHVTGVWGAFTAWWRWSRVLPILISELK